MAVSEPLLSAERVVRGGADRRILTGGPTGGSGFGHLGGASAGASPIASVSGSASTREGGALGIIGEVVAHTTALLDSGIGKGLGGRHGAEPHSSSFGSSGIPSGGSCAAGGALRGEYPSQARHRPCITVLPPPSCALAHNGRVFRAVSVRLTSVVAPPQERRLWRGVRPSSGWTRPPRAS